jgi:hypothetical protein
MKDFLKVSNNFFDAVVVGNRQLHDAYLATDTKLTTKAAIKATGGGRSLSRLTCRKQPEE